MPPCPRQGEWSESLKRCGKALENEPRQNGSGPNRLSGGGKEEEEEKEEEEKEEEEEWASK